MVGIKNDPTNLNLKLCRFFDNELMVVTCFYISKITRFKVRSISITDPPSYIAPSHQRLIAQLNTLRRHLAAYFAPLHRSFRRVLYVGNLAKKMYAENVLELIVEDYLLEF